MELIPEYEKLLCKKFMVVQKDDKVNTRVKILVCQHNIDCTVCALVVILFYSRKDLASSPGTVQGPFCLHVVSVSERFPSKY